MARRDAKPADSRDIWHLDIEDLLATPREPEKPQSAGPFVITLRTSPTPITVVPNALPRFEPLHVYQLQRREGTCSLFRLCIGIVETELEADAILSRVRELYPKARCETAQADDQAAVERAMGREPPKSTAEVSKSARPARRVPMGAVATETAITVSVGAASDAAATGVASVRTTLPKAAVTVPDPQTPIAFRWDIDELLPGLAAAVPDRNRQPPSDHIERAFDPAQQEEPPPAAPRATEPPAVPPFEVESDSNAVTDEVETLTFETSPLTLEQTPEHNERPPDAAGVLLARDSVEGVLPVEEPADPEAPAGSSPGDSGALEILVAKIGALVESVEAADPVPVRTEPLATASAQITPSVPVPPSAPTDSELVPASDTPPTAVAAPLCSTPVIDSTQTIRALTALELSDDEGSSWFAIQLVLSERPIDPGEVPNLGIFAEYRLYSVVGFDRDRVVHALRLGFFSSESSAAAVAGYLAPFFDAPSLKRVSIAEQQRFDERSVAPRKDVGDLGGRAVIELSAPPALPERRMGGKPQDTAEDNSSETTSLWSRLLATGRR